MLLKNKELESEKVENIEDKQEPNNHKSNRNINLDILKGIGIISVLIGHISSGSAREFVYTYHMCIFFFVSAYLYNEPKYGDNPFEYFMKRIKGIWGKYLFFSTIAILLHNFFNTISLYPPNTKNYSASNCIEKILNSMLFKADDIALGTLWFIPSLLLALGGMSAIIFLSRKITTIISKKCKTIESREINLIKNLLIILFGVFTGILGGYLNINNINLQYHFQTSLVVIPICLVGYFSKVYSNKIKKYYKSVVALIVLSITVPTIWYITNMNGVRIDLYANRIMNLSTFYIVTIIGIAFCISLGKIISKFHIVSKLVSNLGKYSFYIMTLHYIIFKIIDICYANIINEENIWRATRIFVGYPKKLWLVYIIMGCCIPIIIGVINNRIINKVKEKV